MANTYGSAHLALPSDLAGLRVLRAQQQRQQEIENAMQRQALQRALQMQAASGAAPVLAPAAAPEFESAPQSADFSSADNYTPEQKAALFAGLERDQQNAMALQSKRLDWAKQRQEIAEGPQVRKLQMLSSLANIAAQTGQDFPKLAGMMGLDTTGFVAPTDQNADRAAMGSALGLPPPLAIPNVPGQSQKLRDALTLQRTKAAESRIRDVEEANTPAAAAVPSIQRFLELNQQTPTGGVYSLPIVKQVATALSAPRSEMESITSKLVPQIGRQGLPGQASNLDVQMFRSAVVGQDKPLEANMAIGNALIAQAKRNKDYAEFLRTYADAYGDIRGADQAWQGYVNANPIFDPAAAQKGEHRLNLNVRNWRQFFQPDAKGRPPLQNFVK